MLTNEILFRLKKALSLSVNDMLKAYALESYEIDDAHLEKLFVPREDIGFLECSYEELGVFLDGLITLRRGESPQKKATNETIELTNNTVLKKLRIALELKEAQTEIIFALADVELTKQQLSSLFRKEGNKNYRECSDELLLSFIDGLDEFYYVGDSSTED